MTREKIREFTINYEPGLEFATITKGVLVPLVVHSEEGPQAFEKCKEWAEQQTKASASHSAAPAEK